MQGIESIDIFATKGVEYLIVIGYLLVLVGFWRLLGSPARHEVEAGAAARPARKPALWFETPEGVYFHQGHTWATPEDGDLVKVGMDDFARRLLGTPGGLGLPTVGARLSQGERGWAVDVEAESIPMLSPVTGEVVAVNDAVLGSPQLAADPYGEGWFLKVRVPNRGAVLKNLLSGRLARAWMADTVEKLRAMPAGELGTVLPDGGVPVDGFARVLAPEQWAEVAREFLLSE
ncbi:MAG: glycine cleavage system protein H [Gemmatimonadota bacterium]|nr:MAG: glycine cleavage system protein H [Gemmatimonadota bacterium]